MRTKGYKCYNIKCGSCVGKTLCGEPEDTALGCASRMVGAMTNGDRIRSMTDKELALLMGFECCPESRKFEPCDEAKCYECWLDWLRQIAEEELT